MDKIRLEARRLLRKTNPDRSATSQSETVFEPGALDSLWQDILNHDREDELTVNESLLVAHGVLDAWDYHQSPTGDDVEAVNALYAWLARTSFPSSDFAEALEAVYSADGKSISLPERLIAKRSRLSLSISCLRRLNRILHILETENAVDLITVLASFTTEQDPWTTSDTRNDALSVLDSCVQSEKRSIYWPILEDILNSKVRPIFAKTRNPAITSSGRKNFHPTAQSRFDTNLMDPATKPWKFQDVYVTTVLDWILSQYIPADISHLESHFHLHVPPLLSLIDDDSLAFKARGCRLLTKFLTPIHTCHSDLLRRTNLSSVFDDALTPCLLSLPTITPEDEALQILGVAYPALLLVLHTRYHVHSLEDGPSDAATEEDQTAYVSRITNILRDNIISSFHHISSTTPTAATQSYIASFPYPRLSTLLLNQLQIVVQELGIYTIKYLQEIISVVCTTLVNPFGTAYIPLLLAAVSATRAVILNAHPRIWRFRGELLAAFCECWFHVCEDAESIKDVTPAKEDLRNPKKLLQGAVYLLKMAVDAAINADSGNDLDGTQTNLANDDHVDINRECEDLANADEVLRELLFVDIDEGQDEEHFQSQLT